MDGPPPTDEPPAEAPRGASEPRQVPMVDDAPAPKRKMSASTVSCLVALMTLALVVVFIIGICSGH